MKQNKHQKNIKPAPAANISQAKGAPQAVAPGRAAPEGAGSPIALFGGNIIAGIVLLIILYAVMKNNIGYNWMWNTLVKQNMEMMSEDGDRTDEEKNLQRHGNLYRYLSEINKKTPESAVILMPSDSVLAGLDPKLGMENLKLRTVVTFFIYPRKAVYPGSEVDKSLIKNATHVAIVNYSGYENLPAPPRTRQPFDILPLH